MQNHPICVIASRQSNAIRFEKAAERVKRANTDAEIVAALADADEALAAWKKDQTWPPISRT